MDMDYLEKSFSEVKAIDKNGIAFMDGTEIAFGECMNWRHNRGTCVAERNICANPPYFEFFTLGSQTRIVFDKRGLFSKRRNRSDFLKLQQAINRLGYSSYDLS